MQDVMSKRRAGLQFSSSGPTKGVRAGSADGAVGKAGRLTLMPKPTGDLCSGQTICCGHFSLSY